ncbi:MAG: hypothetical protein AABZ60_07405, partial [Planctomycetota bacterium]
MKNLFSFFGLLFLIAIGHGGCADYGLYLASEDKSLEISDHQATRLRTNSDSYLYVPYGATGDDGFITFRTHIRQSNGTELRYLRDFSAIAWCYSKDYASLLVIIDYWKEDEKGGATPMREAVHITKEVAQSLSTGERDSFDVSLFSQFSGYGAGPLSRMTRKKFPQITDDFKPGQLEQVYLAYEIHDRKAKTFQEGHLIDFSHLNEYVNTVRRAKPQKKSESEAEEEEAEEEENLPSERASPQTAPRERRGILSCF